MFSSGLLCSLEFYFQCHFTFLIFILFLKKKKIVYPLKEMESPTKTKTKMNQATAGISAGAFLQVSHNNKIKNRPKFKCEW